MSQDTTGKPPSPFSEEIEASGFDFSEFAEKIDNFLKNIKKRSKICAGAKTKLYDGSFLSVYVHLNEEVKKSKECKACQESQNKLSPYLNCLFEKKEERKSLKDIANDGMGLHLQLKEHTLSSTSKEIGQFYLDLNQVINPIKKDEK